VPLTKATALSLLVVPLISSVHDAPSHRASLPLSPTASAELPDELGATSSALMGKRTRGPTCAKVSDGATHWPSAHPLGHTMSLGA